MWTQFMDMHSGGGRKLEWEYIYIEAPADEAKAIFFNRFGRNPEKVTCTCCGDDYSLTEGDSLEQVTAFNRGCDYAYFRPDGKECSQNEGWVPGKGKPEGYTSRYVERKGKTAWSRAYVPLSEYEKSESIKIIRASEIKDGERLADIPEQGYVWVG